MTKWQISVFLKVMNVLMISLLIVLFVLLGETLVSAQVAAGQFPDIEQVPAMEYNRTTTFPPSAPSLDVTLVVTTYLPIIFRPSSSPSCNPTGGVGGFSPGTYQTTVAGANALIIVGQGYNPQKPTYLSFFLHGADGGYTFFTGRSNPVNKVINDHGWIFISPQSPYGTSWREHPEENNALLVAIFDEMFAKYNVCRDIVIGSSISGGSFYWTGHFFPEKGGEYPAHISLLCGGFNGHDRASRQQIIDLGKNPNVVARSTFDYIYSLQDTFLINIKNSIAFYTEAGFNVDVFEMDGPTHCLNVDGRSLIFERIAADWEDRIQELRLE